MKVFYISLLSLLLSGFYQKTIAQSLSTQQLIEAWKADDTTQTQKAEITYDDLHYHRDEQAFRQRITELNNYIKKHPDGRLQARIIIYTILGTENPDDSTIAFYKIGLDNAIRYADLENDDQLLSEIYSIYPRVDERKGHSFYTFKSLEMQEQMGAHLFPKLYLRYYHICHDLYMNGAYREALNYAKRGVELITASPSGNRDIMVLQDHIAASYLKLGIADSALLYFEKMKETLPLTAKYNDSAYVAIWEGITLSGIGLGLINQQKYTEALPYLRKGLISNMHFNLYDDIGDVYDGYARIDTVLAKYDSALYNWKTAYHYYDLATDTTGMVTALKGMIFAFAKKKQYDSAYFYYDKYNTYSLSLAKRLHTDRLNNLQSQIDFDNALSSLNRAKDTIQFYERFRTIIIIAVILLLIIMGMLYNRYRLKRNYHQKQLEQKNKINEIEAVNAKKQVEAFAKNIIEKDNLINELQEKLIPVTEETNGLFDNLAQHILITDKEWEKFRGEFKKVYPAFFPALQKVLAQMTPAEERLATLIRLELTNQQIANTLGIAKDSVARAKRRLKQRLSLEEGASLEQHIISLS